MTEGDFDHWLDTIVRRTRQVIRGEDAFATTVFLLNNGVLSYHVLVSGEGEPAPSTCNREAFFRQFGRQLIAEDGRPDAIFVAELLETGDGRLILVIFGSDGASQAGQKGFLVTQGETGLEARELVTLTGATAFNPARVIAIELDRRPE